MTTDPDDYQGRHTIIVTITWVNQSEANEPLANAVQGRVTAAASCGGRFGKQETVWG